MASANPAMRFAVLVLAVAGLLRVWVLPAWSWVQLVRSVVPLSDDHNPWLVAMEARAWATWEQELGLPGLQPARRWLVEERGAPPVTAVQPLPQLLPTMTRDDVDLTRPLLAKALFDPRDSPLSLARMMSPPLDNLEVDYFRDAREVNTVPNGRGRLGNIVRNITAGGPEKLGTQTILETHPNMLLALALPRIKELWGDRFAPSDMGLTLTIPVFVGHGTGDTLARTTRTDLHTEPIGNVMLQIEGRKRWTLVGADQSRLMRPTISPDGRAYFFSRLDPLNPDALANVTHYEVVTEPGDVLWLPPWTWHRVQYLPGSTSVSASLFHFRPWACLRNNPLFATLVVPNMFKELAGVKTQ